MSNLFKKLDLSDLRIIFILAGSFFLFYPSIAQQKEKPNLKDSKDGKLDLSDWIIDANGFVPIPLLITEPALGGFGGALGLAFLTPVAQSPPNITTALAGITANGTWFVGGVHSHNVPEKGIRYRFGAVYSNLNISLFRELPIIGEREFAFNFKMLPVFGRITKQLGSSKWYLGANYVYLSSKVSLNEELPDFISEKELDSNISSFGPIIEFDSRDNIFTPNRGMRIDASWSFSQDWIGSDYDYSMLSLASYSYFPIKEKWILGVRLEYQEMFGSPPFFLLPGINLRGIPAARYQNRQTILTEIENRIDINSRWSLMAFGGLAKAFDGFDEFSDQDLAYSIGTGYRYLIARKFGLRMGMDVAFGPDDWGYYIIFGSNWLR